jgi:hypothetical protein
MAEMSLKRSEKNSITENFRSGVLHPEYEVTVTKTLCKFMVRKRKISLTDEQLDDLYEAQAYKNYPTWFASKASTQRQAYASGEPLPQVREGSPERCSQMSAEDDDEAPSSFTRLQSQGSMIPNPIPKRSKKENALFDLQNQLNTQNQ